jgi:hypothetical protein
MSKDPESVPFERRVMQTLAPAASAGVSQTDERWFTIARNATVVDRYSYSSLFTWVRQVLFLKYLFCTEYHLTRYSVYTHLA